MSRYYFEALDPDGVRLTGNLDAVDEAEAFRLLSEQGHTVTELTTKASTSKTPWYLREVSFRSGQAPLESQARCFDQLAIMIEAQLDLGQALDVAANNISDRRLTRDLENVSSALSEGRDVGEAVSHARSFSPIVGPLMSVGLQTNSLSFVLVELSKHLHARAQAGAKLTGALIYPTILLLGSLVVLCVITFFVVPSMMPLFQSFGNEVPGLFRFLDAVRFWITTKIVLSFGVLIGSIALIALVCRALVKSGAFFQLPLLGEALRSSELLKILMPLQLMTKVRMPLSEALRRSAEANRNNLFAESFQDAALELEQGRPVHPTFQRVSHFPSSVIELVRVGEENNRLFDTLGAATRLLQSRQDQATKTFFTLLTPVVTLLIGGFIAILVFAMMSAITQVGSLVP